MAIPSNIDVFVSFQAGAIPLVCAMAAVPFGFLFGLGLVAIIGVIIGIAHKQNNEVLTIGGNGYENYPDY